MTQKTSWRLTTLNLNGIRAASRKGLNEWLPTLNTDVIALQEVRATMAQVEKTGLPVAGYHHRHSEAEKRGYSGTALWSRQKPLSQHSGIGLDWADREGRAVCFQLPQATIYSLYVPSGSNGRQAEKDEYLQYFANWARELLATGAPIALVGDFNIAHTELDIHNPKGNAKNSGFLPHERQWMTALLAQGWVDSFRSLHPKAQTYSWWSYRGRARERDRGWRLDYVLISPSLADKLVSVEITGRTPGISDHCAVTAEFSL